MEGLGYEAKKAKFSPSCHHLYNRSYVSISLLETFSSLT